MTRGRKPLLDPPIGIEIHIPRTIFARVSLALLDPVRGTRKKGALSTLIAGLLNTWLDEQGHTGVALPHEREPQPQLGESHTGIVPASSVPLSDVENKE